MKRIILLAVIAACGGTSTGDDDGVDGGTDAAIDGGVCGDGACADAETPDTCGSDCVPGGPVCGDGTCEGSESPANCASDCGAPACTAAADNCTGEDVCRAGVCVAAFPRVYVITNISVVLPPTNANNLPWDTDGTAPDIYVGDVKVPDSSTPISPVVPNSLTPTFTGPFDTATLNGGPPFKVLVWDDDSPPATGRQIAAGCQWFLNAATMRTHTLSCAYSTASNGAITLTINPK